MRAIHSTSDIASVRSACSALSDFSSIDFAVLRLSSFAITSPLLRAHHDAVAAADRRRRRYDDDVAVAIGRLHRLAGDFERISVLVVDGGKRDLVPAVAGRKAAVVEIAAGAGLGEAEQRHRLTVAPAPAGSISVTKASNGVPVAASALAIDSVEGQRARPCGVMRFDLLKVVGSSPARRASPDADSPARAARRSMADQTCACVSIRTPTPARSRKRSPPSENDHAQQKLEPDFDSTKTEPA